ncbi:MAG: hypothetical protein ACO2O2_04720 [Acidilobaceae archaeon]
MVKPVCGAETALSLRIAGVYLGDPVVLLLSAILAGLIVFLIASKTFIHHAHGTLPRGEEFRLTTGFSDFDLAFLASMRVVNSIIESFLLLGAVTAIAGSYMVGMGRDQGYTALSTLVGLGRRAYIRALTLYPLTLYQMATVPGSMVALALIDPNLIRYWKLVVATTLIALAVVQVQLTIAILATYILANTYRGVIATIATLLLITTIGIHNNIARIIQEKQLMNEILATTLALTIATTLALSIAYIIVETRMTVR